MRKVMHRNNAAVATEPQRENELPTLVLEATIKDHRPAYFAR